VGLPYELGSPKRVSAFTIGGGKLEDDIPLPTDASLFTGPHAASWQASLDKEHAAFDRHEVCNLILRSLVPDDVRILRMKCVWKVKCSQEGLAACFKSWWVVCGQHMVEGIHYFQSWAPTARATSIKILLTIAGVLGLKLVLYDVVSAFLVIKVVENIYVYPGKGFMHRGKCVPHGFVLKLNKSCYGIKSASRYFWIAMDEHLCNIGFTPTNVDPCLYSRRSRTAITIIGLIVDDIVCATSKDPLILLEQLKQHFETTYEGELSYVLGLHATRELSTGHVFLDQQRYIE
jgi:hypothetical protein